MPDDRLIEVARYEARHGSAIGCAGLVLNLADALEASRVPTPEASAAREEPKSIVRLNAEKDPNYRPYCGRCPGLVRMQKVAPFLWRCGCGAQHDERFDAAPIGSDAPSDTERLDAARWRWFRDRFLSVEDDASEGGQFLYMHDDSVQTVIAPGFENTVDSLVDAAMSATRPPHPEQGV